MTRSRTTRSGKQSGNLIEGDAPIRKISARHSKEEASRILNAPKRVGQTKSPQVSTKAIESSKKLKNNLNKEVALKNMTKRKMAVACASQNKTDQKDVRVIKSRLVKTEAEKRMFNSKASEKLTDPPNDINSESLTRDSRPVEKLRTLRNKIYSNDMNEVSSVALTKQAKLIVSQNAKTNTSCRNRDLTNISVEASSTKDGNSSSREGKVNETMKSGTSAQSRKKPRTPSKTSVKTINTNDTSNVNKIKRNTRSGETITTSAPSLKKNQIKTDTLVKTLKKSDASNANDTRKKTTGEKINISVPSGKKAQSGSKTLVKTGRHADSLNSSIEFKSSKNKSLPKSGDKDEIVDTSVASKNKKTLSKMTKIRQTTSVTPSIEKKALKRKYSKNDNSKSETSMDAESIVGDNSVEMPKPSSQPSNKKRKTDPKSVSKEKQKRGKSGVAAANVDEDPYDFEAYVSTFDIAKRKPKLKPKSSEKAASFPLPQKSAKGTGVKRAPAHMFFIQPCRVKRKGPTVSGEQREEPSPSIADEILEFNMQPPFAGDPEEGCTGIRPPPAPPAVPAKSVAISTPRHNLTGVPLLRPSQGPGLSPIVASSGAPTPAGPSVAVLVESSRTNSPSRKTSAPLVEEKPEEERDVDKPDLFCSVSTEEGDSGTQGKQKRKGRSKDSQKADEKEKNEFESWLAKFNQELSELESFQLSIDRSQ